MTGSRMLAEIREQPDVLRELARRAVSEWKIPKSLFRTVQSAVVLGSGSSYHAALLAKLYLERIAGMPTRAEHASEAFRHKVPGRPLAIGFSHSGASTDVRAALRRARRQGAKTLGLTNLDASPLTRDADFCLVTPAGAEEAIPSTKGFTALVAAAHLLAAERANAKRIAAAAIRRASRAIESVERSSEVAARVASSKAVVVLGEGLSYPAARDGALKLLEVTQIPSVSYPTGEFRHGPFALLEPGVVVVALDADTKLRAAIDGSGAALVILPPADGVPMSARPLVAATQLQYIAHDAGVQLGRDVDRPRALTKIVR